MDNKITKSRLSNFLAYEWMVMILAIVGLILGWELIFSVAQIKPTASQTFTFFYDLNVSAVNNESKYKFLEDTNTFSFDILEVRGETLSAENPSLLDARLATFNGDIIITDNIKINEGKENETNNAEEFIKNYPMYTIEGLIDDATAYLLGLVKTDSSNPLEYNDLEETAIESLFDRRMQGDNRYRYLEDRLKGYEQEKARIKKLCEDTAYLKAVLEADSVKSDADSIFYRSGDGVMSYSYGLNVGKFNKGKYNEYFKLKDGVEGGSVIIMAFDLYEAQRDMQFEVISYFTTILRQFVA